MVRALDSTPQEPSGTSYNLVAYTSIPDGKGLPIDYHTLKHACAIFVLAAAHFSLTSTNTSMTNPPTIGGCIAQLSICSQSVKARRSISTTLFVIRDSYSRRTCNGEACQLCDECELEAALLRRNCSHKTLYSRFLQRTTGGIPQSTQNASDPKPTQWANVMISGAVDG